MRKTNYWKTYEHGFAGAYEYVSGKCQTVFPPKSGRSAETHSSKLKACLERYKFERSYYGWDYASKSPTRRYLILAQHYLPYAPLYNYYKVNGEARQNYIVNKPTLLHL